MFKILILNIFLLFHPVHVSLTTIKQASGSETLNVSFRMYFDDFQRDFRELYPGFKSVNENDSLDYPDEMLYRFFTERVRIYINSRLLDGRLTDVSINSYEILLTLKYQSYRKPRKIRVRNQILVSIYGDQANMVYIDINNYQDAMKLTVENVERSIKLK